MHLKMLSTFWNYRDLTGLSKDLVDRTDLVDKTYVMCMSNLVTGYNIMTQHIGIIFKIHYIGDKVSTKNTQEKLNSRNETNKAHNWPNLLWCYFFWNIIAINKVTFPTFVYGLFIMQDNSDTIIDESMIIHCCWTGRVATWLCSMNTAVVCTCALWILL